MRRHFTLLLVVLFFLNLPASHALKYDSLPSNVEQKEGGLRISILTVGVGQQLYASFGHSGIRIIDSARGTDVVYNYGVFDFRDPHFYTKFTLGRLLYFIDKSSFRNFMYEYVVTKRTVEEQVLNLPAAQKQAIQQFLETNLQPQNRSYLYNFLYDNCATRVRDVFIKSLGSQFHFGNILHGEKISYREIINRYLAQKHWERFGINLLLGKPVDSLMSETGCMFLPQYLHDGLKDATFRGHPVVSSDQFLLAKTVQETHPLDGPLWMMIGIFILTFLSYQTAAFHYLKGFFRFVLLFASGLLGCFMLFMWLGTEHSACANNFNVLWALPFNIIIAFFAHRKTRFLKYYAVFGVVLLLLAITLSVFGFQRMPLFELAPFLLCLFLIYVDFWKQSTHSVNRGAAAVAA